ncbi:hypothetical protein D2V93_08905 [Flagellimonas taeanensis]|nr:hypothetical protein D2V93_08905 [Allomuricauda taeanensis]
MTIATKKIMASGVRFNNFIRSFEISDYKTSISPKLFRPKTKLFDEIHSHYENLKQSGFRRHPKLDELQVILTLFNIQALFAIFAPGFSLILI